MRLALVCWRRVAYGLEMELRHLRYFRAVAQALNFSRAAEQLHVAQPALSRQVKALEDELGVKLFNRNRVHVQMTDAGRLFFAHVEKILAQVDMATAAVREVESGEEGQLIVCTEWRLPIRLLPSVISEFRNLYPRVEVDLRDVSMTQHLTLVRSGRAHLGFVPKGMLGLHSQLTYLPLLTSRVVIALPAQHPLATRTFLRLAELNEAVWVRALRDDQDNGYQTMLTQTCRLAGFTPRFGKSARVLEGLLGLVSSGFGVALLPETIVRQSDAPGVALVPTDCEPMEIGAIWSEAECAKSRLLSNFIDILRRAIEAQRQPGPVQ